MHLQREAEVLNKSEQFGADENFHGKKALRLRCSVLFCLTQKSHETIKQKNECHALSLRTSISKPKGKRKEKKNNYTIHVQHAGFFINIMSLP